MRDKYGADQDKYCYSNSDVLINRLNILDSDELEKAEIEFTSYRYLSYKSNVSEIKHLDFNHLKCLHHHLFQDIFEWAGQVREVKATLDSVPFLGLKLKLQNYLVLSLR